MCVFWGDVARPPDLHLSQKKEEKKKKRRKVPVRKLKTRMVPKRKALREQGVCCGDVPAAPRSAGDISVDDKQKFRCLGK